MDTTQGLIVVISGMLIIIVLIIALLLIMLKFLRETKRTIVSTEDPTQKGIPANTNLAQQTVYNQVQDDEELVAVITATIATMLNTTTDRLVVTSFRRVETKTQWSAK